MVDLLLFISGLIIVLSLLSTDIMVLRAVPMVSLAINVICGFVVGYRQPGMMPFICFSAVSFCINGFQLVKLILNKKTIKLPTELNELYLTNFKKMSSNEFFRLYKLATKKKFKNGDRLTIQNQPVDSLMLITQGQVQIIKNDQCVSTIGANFFIGEMSFLSEETANATVVVASDEVDILSWDKAKLRQLQKEDFHLFDEMETALAINLIKKINS